MQCSDGTHHDAVQALTRAHGVSHKAPKPNMLRSGTSALARAARRGLHTTAALRAEEAVASKHTTAQFLEQWKVTAPSTLDPPIFPSNNPSFVAASNEIPATIPEKLTFTFYMPHNCELNAEQVPQPIRPVFCGAEGARGTQGWAAVCQWIPARMRYIVACRWI